ncbi:MAG: SCO family protein [Gammaproteobacteria bacterium]|nr:SCO family protein [Gammaproteobacteria bacterium]
MESCSRNLILCVVLGSALALAACSPSQPQVTATLLPEPRALPDFELVLHDGRAFTRDSLRDAWTLLFFGFTHCPDICPNTLQKLAMARAQLAGQQNSAALPRIVLISVDPDRDSGEILAEYVSYFGSGIAGATGSMEQLLVLTGHLGIFFQKDPATDGNYNVSHSTAVLLINPDAELHAVLASPLTVEAVARDLSVVIAQR